LRITSVKGNLLRVITCGMSPFAILCQVIFLATGIITTICNQLVTYSGAGEKSSLLLSIPT
jgi:hypothetical protein